MATIVCILNRKGGVGKTTVSTNLAVEFAAKGQKVALVDGDVNQHATKFGAVFCARYPEVPIQFHGDVNRNNIAKIIRDIEALKEEDGKTAKIGVIIVDLPAGNSEMANKAVMLSHFVLVPSGLSPLDVRDAARTMAQIAEAELYVKHSIPSALIWTRVKSRRETRGERDVRNAIEDMIEDPQAILKMGMLEYDAYSSGFIASWVPRQLADSAGKPVTLENPNAEPNEFIVPTSAKHAAENMNAISDEILRRLALILKKRPVPTLTLKPDVLEAILSQSDSDTEAA